MKEDGLEARARRPGAAGLGEDVGRDVVPLVIGVDVGRAGPDRDAQGGLAGAPPLARFEPDGTRGGLDVEVRAGQGAQVLFEGREEDLPRPLEDAERALRARLARR